MAEVDNVSIAIVGSGGAGALTTAICCSRLLRMIRPARFTT